MKNQILILVILLSANLNAQLCFEPCKNFSSGTSNIAFATADFNNDGKRDIVSIEENWSYITIMLGTGTGSFAPLSTFTVGDGNYEPVSVVTDDFNEDGKTDIALANLIPGNVSIFLGTGTGSFLTQTDFAVGNGGAYAIINADFNKDGHADLAVGCGTSISLILGTGTNSFSSPAIFSVSPISITYSDPRTLRMVSADFNGDSNPDIAISAQGGHLYTLFGSGTGSLGNANPVYIGIDDGGPFSMIKNDFNGDHKIDLALGSVHKYAILLGDSIGSFATQFTYSVSGTELGYLASADFNNDGHVDLAFGDANTYSGMDEISVSTGTSVISFGSFTNFSLIPGASPYNTLSDDFNNDGKPDIAVNYSANGMLSVLLNCTISGIEEYNYEQEVSIYPNPNRGNFIVETNSLKKMSVELFDVSGRLMLTNNFTIKTNINTTNLESGIYFVKLKGTEKEIISTKKIIVQH